MRRVALLLLFAFTAHIANDGDGTGVGGADVVVGNANNTVVISGTQTQNPPDDTTPRDSSTSPSPPSSPVHEFDFDSCLNDWNSARGCFRGTEAKEESPPPPGVETPSAPAITITDLAQFSPAPVTAIGEPDNVGVVGMPTNFVAAASVQTRSGSLFGAPLSVRFTPVGYEFVHGDDTTTTTATGGQTWSALGQAAFTPTATSHTYRERGTYQAHVTVRYTAEIDLGGGWFPLAGQLAIDGPAQEIRVFEAHTALVAFTCQQRPSAPGC